MKNKTSFNSGRGGKIAGRGPNNSSVIAGSSKKAAYSEAEILNLSRRKIGEDYNKFQDKIKKDFEKYLKENKSETEITNLGSFFNLLSAFFQIQQQNQNQQFANEVKGAANVIADLRKSSELKNTTFPAKGTTIKNILAQRKAPKAVVALIMILATNELVAKVAIDESTSDPFSKATNAVALGVAGGAIAGPVGAVAGIIVGGLVSEVEANNKVKQEDFDQFWNGCASGYLPIVRSKISQAKAQGSLQALLTKVDQVNKLSPLSAAIRQGKYEVVSEILASVKNNPKLLEIILTQIDAQGDLPLAVAIIVDHKIVSEILASVKNNPHLLKIILTKDHHERVLPLYLAAYYGKHEAASEILASVKDNPELLKIILTKTDKEKRSPLYIAADSGRAKIVKEILASVKDNPKLLEIILTQTDKKNKATALCVSAYQADHEIIREILASVKDKPKLLKTILTQTDTEKRSPFYVAAFQGNHEFVKEILASVKDDSELLEAVTRKPPEAFQLSAIDHLLMANNKEAVKTILEVNPKAIGGKLPDIYASNVSKGAIYYLEAFLKTDQNNKVKYFEIGKNSKLQEVKFDNIKFSSDRPEPTIIEIANKGQSRKILLFNDIESKIKNSNLQKAVKIANNKEAKINDVIFNFEIGYEEGNHAIRNHAITIKMIRNAAKGGWDVVMHDPNSHSLRYRSDIHEKANKEAITKAYQEAGIKITSLKEGEAIIPNHSNNVITTGSCNMISLITSASMILGDEHSKQLREKCDKIGVKCVEVLGQELNPEIDKILAAKLQLIKEEIAEERAKTKVTSPSKSIKNAKADAINIREAEREL